MITSFAGNDRVIAAIDALINEHRLPHAIMLSGDAGTGKHTLAAVIAKALMCENGGSACGECRGCSLADSGNHPDIIFVRPDEGKKSITVKKAREIRLQAFVKAHMSGRKVFIIENAETLADDAQNILLKVLEEPPENVCFILLSLNSAALLQTIISRCVCFELSTPTTLAATEFLKRTTDYTDSEIAAALSSAKNNIGAALSCLRGNSDEEIQLLADEFCTALFQNASAYELLKMLHRLEKDRRACEAFIGEAKSIIAKKAVSAPQNLFSVGKLMKYHEIISEAEPSLITNINLSLFLSALVCALKEI